ncbi:MAG: Holliday junction branch migration protein RuvA [Actinomycetaceae bacterium]|nr:Holliday junction branch migration protein RuvA [Actinomycetaceae bacterium]MDY6083266.1 Holliday junction branch migration protein RuvA [Actinomycetaceae bacterium]
MIAHLAGEVLSVQPHGVVIDVGGMGFFVTVPDREVSTLTPGSRLGIFTSLVVREDSLSLFGFVDEDERDVFDALRSVSGVGPKLAVAIISTFEPNELRRVVDSGDALSLTRVPGIGKKNAQRIIVNLDGKLAHSTSDTPSGAIRSAHRAVADDVTQALVGLGWSEQDALGAVQSALNARPEGSSAELLKAALQFLGSRR